MLRAFDLVELDSEDLRRLPIEQRKRTLAGLVGARQPGLGVNGDGDIVHQQACKLGCEGIVAKLIGSTSRSGRVKHWIKIKNPAAPAVRCETEEGGGVEIGSLQIHVMSAWARPIFPTSC